MTEAIFANELSSYERGCLLGAPYSELRVTLETNQDVILYHRLNLQQLCWLAKELGYKAWSDTLYQVLEAITWDELVYTIYFKKKRGGDFRKILAPAQPLKDVQKKILKNILALYPTSKSAFGYSGGNVFDAISPHLEVGNQTLFSTDITDAFGSVSFEAVFAGIYGLPITRNYSHERESGYLAWEVAYALTRLTTCGSTLPQGAPTSPRLFDMVFLVIDQKLEHLAENVGGVYTRYADNIYFSMPTQEFPDVIARAIIRTIHENKHHRTCYGYSDLMQARRFHCHKTCTRPLGDEAIRVLGVNVVGGEIHPTRQLKKRIRLSIHRLNWLLLNTPYDWNSIAKCWGILQGQMAFASKAVLPEPLLRQYQHAKSNYEGLIFNGVVPTTMSPTEALPHRKM